MNSFRSFTIVATLTAMSVVFTPRIAAPDDGHQKTTTFSVTDIGRTVKLIGRFGQPLGTMMDVQGTWNYPVGNVKDYSLRFTVSHVNGKKLKRSLELNVAQVTAVSRDGSNAIPDYKNHNSLVGVTWTLRAYETGRFGVTPQEYWKERGEAVQASPYYWGTFLSELDGVVVRAEQSKAAAQTTPQRGVRH